MSSVVRVKCYFCHKQFLTKRAYFVFNKEVGYHSFCSKKCHYKSKLRGRILTCDNPACNKRFYRAPSDILLNNYCSKSCATIVNNQKYPKYPPRYCAYRECKNLVKRDSPYCSLKCGKLSKFKYTKKEIIDIIKKHHQNTDTIPSKRELSEISHKATHLFGSWNNAITTANLNPNRSHNNRMYKRLCGKAIDGHKCDSISEILIDNWLTKNNISHTRDAKYPTTNHKTDWVIKDNVFVEYFGLAKDSPRYDRGVKVKKNLCRKNNIKLIEIYPSDLYPVVALDKKLRSFL